VPQDSPGQRVGEKSTADAIADRLLEDPALAHEVYKRLASKVINEYQKKRRSTV
jgi:hypothetical protein